MSRREGSAAAGQALSDLAWHDPLTGLPNRASLAGQLPQAVADARAAGEPLVLLCLDIGALKDIQDSAGLLAADQAIRLAADHLRRVLAAAGPVFHCGGGYFCAILAGVTADPQAPGPLRDLVASLERPLRFDGDELYLDLRLGIAALPGSAEDADALLRQAGLALVRAKVTQGQPYRLYGPEMADSAERREAIEADLRSAVARGAIEVFYQPQVHPRTYRIVGVEALARWRHPQRGFVAPSEFIGIAERSGLIVSLGEQVLRLACRQMAVWRERGLAAFPLSINVAGRQLRRPDFAAGVLRTLSASGLPPEVLTLELTESALAGNVESIAPSLEQLAAVGVAFAVDGFGTGPLALHHLSQLPISIFKVDRILVARLTDGDGNAALMQAIVALARALRRQVVAQGVETMEELAQLRGYGCDALQGFLFSEAVPPKAMERLLEDAILPPLRSFPP